jgi:long-chain fatty acid transport protein
MNKCLFFLLVALVPGSALAAGYELMEQDAVAQSRSLAVIAKLDAPSTLFYNPAGLAFLDGLQVSAGTTVLVTGFRYEDPTGDRASAYVERFPPTTPVNLWASWRVLKDVTVGAGLAYAPWGMKFTWPKGFAGEYMLGKADLRIPVVLLGAAWRPIRWLAVGAFFNYAPATMEMWQRVTAVDDNGDPQLAQGHLAGSGQGFGGGFGIQARPIERLYLGASWRSRVSVDYTGNVHFEVPGQLADRSVFHDQPIKTNFTTPDIFGFGVGYDLLDNLYAELAVHYTLWSVFETNAVKFPEDASGQLSTNAPMDWVDTLTFRLGAEYKGLPGVPGLTLRMGGGYDQTPVPDSTITPALPDAARFFGGAGAQYTFKSIGLNLALAWQCTYFVPRTVMPEDQPEIKGSIPQKYTNFAQLISVSVGYALGL